MLLGFILLSLNVENVFQRLFTYVFLFWTKSFTKILILKNLTAHRIRNRKTSLMYSLSVGFFIMITVGLNIELSSLKLTKLSKRGVYAQLQASGHYVFPNDIKDSLEEMINSKIIDNYTFVSPKLSAYCWNGKYSVMNKGKSMDFTIDVHAVSPNFYSVAMEEFLTVDEQEQKNADISLSEKLYLSKNEGKVGMSGIFSWEINLHLEDNFYLVFEKDAKMMPFIFQSSFILHSSPTLQMAAEPSMMYVRSVIIPIHTYIDIVNKCQNYYTNSRDGIYNYAYEDFPIDKVLLKLNKEMDSSVAMKKIQDIVYKDPKYLVSMWFYSDSEQGINKISTICNVIFIGVSIVVLFFCFFNLTATMSINIFDQVKELAILRSLGMTTNQITFIYVSEAFILIFTASFMGLVIGTIISWTMTLQRIIFTNLPLTFVIPYWHILGLFIISLLGGFLSTILPAKSILRKTISTLIKS
jgi:ABC-type antimicrobial peptide transport system permease subunit